MKSFATDNDYDLVLSDVGNLLLREGKEAIADAARCAVRTLLGEMPLSASRGLPYMESIYKSPALTPLFQAYAYEELGKVEGVNSIESFHITVADGTLTLDAILNTDFGAVQLNG